MKETLTFKADKMSGLGVHIFATSMVMQLMSENGRQNLFKFQFYALTFNDSEQRCDEWVNNELYTKESMRILDYINKNGVSYFEEIKRLVTSQSADFFKLAKKVIPKIKSLSDIELMRGYSHFMNVYIEYYGLGGVTFIYESELSQYLHDSLASRYKNIAHILTPLLASSYRSFMTAGEPLLFKIKNTKRASLKKSLIKKYIDEFFYIKASYCGAQILDAEMVLTMAESVGAENNHGKSEPDVEVELSSEEKNLVALFKETEVIRDQRKKTNLIGSYTMFRFLDEVCKRKKIHAETARKMYWFELAEAVATPEELVKKLEKRNEVSLVYDKGSLLYLDYSAIKPRAGAAVDTKEIKGTPASKGNVQGLARIVLSQRDFHKFKNGEVLISEMT